MRGGGFHRWLVCQLESAARQSGCWTQIEAFVGNGFADLVIGYADRLIVIEIELTTTRIPKDIAKANHIGATQLWIIAPDSTQLGRYRRRAESVPGSRTRVLVLSQPQALRALAQIGDYLDRLE